ncbi:MAG: hypothetical protein ACKKMV_00590 [Candidatus Nealsonbacteria bacterium]|nr:MAG: hypothetical protein IB617_01300 [Candidatus Nealsonbacteria bacterium]
MERIYLVITHGDYEKNLADPGLTPNGKQQMKESKYQLSAQFNLEECFLISGTGNRHLDACLEFAGRKPDIMSDFAGKKEVMAPDGKIIFPDGTKVPFTKLLSQYKDALKETLNWLKKILSQSELGNILIIGGRIVVIAAGVPRQEAKSACIYRIWLTEEGELKIKEFKSI